MVETPRYFFKKIETSIWDKSLVTTSSKYNRDLLKSSTIFNFFENFRIIDICMVGSLKNNF